jgi:hypothetical protein
MRLGHVRCDAMARLGSRMKNGPFTFDILYKYRITEDKHEFIVWRVTLRTAYSCDCIWQRLHLVRG